MSSRWVFANSEISREKAYFALAVKVINPPTIIPGDSKSTEPPTVMIMLDEPGFAKVATLFSQIDTTRMKSMSPGEQIVHIMNNLMAGASESAEKAEVDKVHILSAYAYALVHMWERFNHKKPPETAVSADICTRLGAWLMANHPAPAQ